MKRNKVLLIISLFIGINAIIGSGLMFIDKTGSLLKMNYLLIYFKVLPLSNILFNDYLFSGICLLIINGITNIAGSIMLIKNKKISYDLEIIFGILLMLWIIIQFIILPFNLLSLTFFLLGLIQTILAYICKVRYIQSVFKINYDEYKNINKDKFNIKEGIYTDPEVYTNIDNKDLEIFDKNFPHKEKLKLEGQLE